MLEFFCCNLGCAWKTLYVPRPETHAARSLDTLEAIYGDLDKCAYLHYRQVDGTITRTKLHETLLELTRVRLFHRPDGAVVHYCYVEEGSVEHQAGKMPGDPCCDNDMERAEKEALPVMQVMAKKWDDQPVGRWTFTYNALRKLATLYSVAGNVFKDSLLSYRDFKQLSDSLIPALETLISGSGDNDSSAFQARGKLRLIRICQTLATEKAGGFVAIMVTALGCVGTAMYTCFSSAASRDKALALHQGQGLEPNRRRCAEWDSANLMGGRGSTII